MVFRLGSNKILFDTFWGVPPPQFAAANICTSTPRVIADSKCGAFFELARCRRAPKGKIKRKYAPQARPRKIMKGHGVPQARPKGKMKKNGRAAGAPQGKKGKKGKKWRAPKARAEKNEKIKKLCAPKFFGFLLCVFRFFLENSFLGTFFKKMKIIFLTIETCFWK